MRRSNSLMVASFVTIVGGLVGVSALAQQGVPSQPGTPSKQPGPKDPTPRPNTPNQQTPLQPANPNNPNTNPQNQPPATPVPADDPNNPEAPVNPGNGNTPVRYDPIDGQTQTPANENAARYQRPFAFQSPEIESRFNESSRRLVRMEQRIDKANRDMLKRLGEVRQLPAEKQQTAVMELLQRMLQEQSETHQYLVQARMSFTGDIEMPSEDASNGTQVNAGQKNPTNYDQPRLADPRALPATPEIKPNNQTQTPAPNPPR